MIVACFCGWVFEVDPPDDLAICPKCLLFHDDLLGSEDED